MPERFSSPFTTVYLWSWTKELPFTGQSDFGLLKSCRDKFSVMTETQLQCRTNRSLENHPDLPTQSTFLPLHNN